MLRKRRCMEKIVVATFACLFSILLTRPVKASQTGALDHVQHLLNRVMDIQTNPKLAGSAHRAERKKEIKAVLIKNFDTDRMAKDSLGDYWQKLNAKQRAEFTGIFRDLFQDSYTRLVLDFLTREEIRYSPAEPTNGEALVKTIILRPYENIPVDYLLEKAKTGWSVCDVTIDGVSIVQKYEDAFSRVIQMKSYDVLLDKLRLQQKAIQATP